MKYIFKTMLFVIMTAYLLIERTIKILMVVLVFLWAFNTKKKTYNFFKEIDVYLFLAVLVFDSIRDYYRFEPKDVSVFPS